MNILYCGDQGIRDGLLLSILSLMKNISEPLHIYILTAELHGPTPCKALPTDFAAFLDQLVKQHSPQNFVERIDISNLFQRELPEANLKTRFTPGCMLRLFADEVPQLPDRLLYLDYDVVCRKDIAGFYHLDLKDHELAGVLDYYGRWFFRRNIFRMDYLNSGVLLLNMDQIQKTGLFRKCRAMCQTKKMFMPDQSAINKLAASKLIVPRKYNEQRKLHSNTVLQHFTTSFRFFPWFRTVSVKPWHIDALHNTLCIYEYDTLLEEYLEQKNNYESTGKAAS